MLSATSKKKDERRRMGQEVKEEGKKNGWVLEQSGKGGRKTGERRRRE